MNSTLRKNEVSILIIKKERAVELVTPLKEIINVKLKEYLVVTARHNPEGFHIHIYFTTDLEKRPLKKPWI